MRLVFINEIGTDHKGKKQYEFIFSESTSIENDEWFTIPASACSGDILPSSDIVDFVGLLKNTDMDMELVQNSDYFGIIDAVDGIISLGWEKFDYDNEDERLYFRFGETLPSVARKLATKNYSLLKEEIN